VKLKREVQGKITVLTLSETYQVQDLAVLRAGVTKLAAAGQDKLIILDITGAKPSTPSLASELNALPLLAAEHQVALLIAGPQHAELGGATLADAKKKLISPEFKASLEETFLNAKLNRLERRKKELLDLEKKAVASEPELLALRKRNQQLRKQIQIGIRTLETSLQESEALYKAPPESKELGDAREEFKKALSVISPILDQLGVAKL